jgi:2'-5' RNA ligase
MHTVMVRAFVAFEISEEMRELLKAAQDTFKKSSCRLTFVDPPLIHITVKFLGEVDERKLPLVISALKTIKFVPFAAKGSRITVNNFKSPHTVWCAIDDAGKGREVFSAVETALAPLGFARETRAFTPHATLARVRMANPSLFRCLEELKDAPCGYCLVTGLKLKKSTLTSRGPVYEDIAEVAW